MSELARSIRAAREAFIDDLLSTGFKQQAAASFFGEIDVAGRLVEHVITIPADFPVAMPKVHTTDGTGGMSWHRERTGHFCLWSAEQASHLPWGSAQAVIARVQDWHAQDAAGWPGDAPDLDLERYWRPVGALIIHGDLDGLDGVSLRVDRTRNGAWLARAGTSNRRRAMEGIVVDAGELTNPVHTIDELLDALDPAVAKTTQRRIDKGPLFCILVRYTRQGHPGVLGLVRSEDTSEPYGACSTAHAGASTVRLRAGLDADALADKAVAIVGLGAVGSHVADLLARSGIGRLTLADANIVRPGNCIRHLVGREHVGLHKVEAVRRTLAASGFIDKGSVATLVENATTVEQLETLSNDHDLLIDATGNGPPTALVLLASKVLDQPAITVCLQHDGRVVRVDRAPLRHGEQHQPALPPDPAPHQGSREGGCGDPISPTPPWAVLTAASIAVGAAVDTLTARNQYPPTLVQVLVTSPSLSHPIGTT